MSAPNTRRRQRQTTAAHVHAPNVVRLFSEDRPPIVQRLRGRYPKGVVHIRAVPRFRVGALVELVGIKRDPEANGARGVIVEDNGSPGWRYLVGLDRNVICRDGKPGRDVWFRERNLRRVLDWRQVEEIRRLKESLAG